jgi:hypothetical protein
MNAHEGRPEWGSVYAQKEAMKDALARCHKKTAIQVCTLTIIHCRLVSVHIHVMTCLYFYPALGYLSLPLLHVQNLIHNSNWCLFRRLKINHDVHELILDSGTVANTIYV